jgi:hypothetical protein
MLIIYSNTCQITESSYREDKRNRSNRADDFTMHVSTMSNGINTRAQSRPETMPDTVLWSPWAYDYIELLNL